MWTRWKKKNLDWANLGFGYMTTDYRYVANYKNGAWDKGGLTDDPTVNPERMCRYFSLLPGDL